MKVVFDHTHHQYHHQNHLTIKDMKKEVLKDTTRAMDYIMMSGTSYSSNSSTMSSSSSCSSSGISSSGGGGGDGLGNSSSTSICSSDSRSRSSNNCAIYNSNSDIKTDIVSINNKTEQKKTKMDTKVMLLSKSIKSSIIKGTTMTMDNSSNNSTTQQKQQHQNNGMTERRILSKYPTYTDYSNVPKAKKNLLYQSSIISSSIKCEDNKVSDNNNVSTTTKSFTTTTTTTNKSIRTNHNIAFPALLHQMLSIADQYPNEFIVPRYPNKNKNKHNTTDKDKKLEMSFEQIIIKQNSLRVQYYKQQKEQFNNNNNTKDDVQYIKFCPNEIIRWENHGRSFVIIDKKQFVQYYFPLFLPYQNEYASFQRQLNLYGYIRLVNNEKCKMIISSSTTTSGNNKQAIIVLRYYHEKFLRTRSDITNQIQRFYPSSSNNSNEHGTKNKKTTPMSNKSSNNKCKRNRQTFDPATEPIFDNFPPLLYHPTTTTTSMDTSTTSVGANEVSMRTNTTISSSTSSSVTKMNIDLLMQQQSTNMTSSSLYHHHLGTTSSMPMMIRSNSCTSIASSTNWSVNDMDDSINVSYHNNDRSLNYQYYNHQYGSNSSENISNTTTAMQHQQFEQYHTNDLHNYNSSNLIERLSSSTLLLESHQQQQQQIKERLLVKSKPNNSQFKRNQYIQNQLNKQLQEEQQFNIVVLNKHDESTEHHQQQEKRHHQQIDYKQQPQQHTNISNYTDYTKQEHYNVHTETNFDNSSPKRRRINPDVQL